MTLAQRVRDQRYAKGWGPDELAGRASISRTALYQIERGKTGQPRAATLRRIALALDVPTEALLGPHLGILTHDWGAPPTPKALDRNRPEEPALAGDLDRKFREILSSPYGEGVARIVEETHRLLPQAIAESRL